MKYLIVFISIFQGCQEVSIIDIKDVSKDTGVTIKSSLQTPFSAKVEIKGTVNDTFEVNNGKMPGGKVDTFYYFDCYEEIFKLKYSPYKAKKGQLKIKTTY